EKDSYKTHHNLGNVYYRKSDYERALLNYKKALQFCNDNYKIYYDIAVTYISLKDYNNAIENYKSALILKEDLYSMAGLANAYIATNQPNLAMPLAERITSINNYMGTKISEQIKNKIDAN
ncbi:MAG: tetratricopeptide repeat protein, partial [Vampirovibrionia bacterium]